MTLNSSKKSLVIAVFLVVIKVATSKYKQLSIEYSGGLYLIDLFIGSRNQSFPLAIDTSAPYSLISSADCSICEYGYNQTRSSTTVQKAKNQTYLKGYHNFTGDIFSDNFYFSEGDEKNEFDFLSFTNISFATSYYGTGYFSLSYSDPTAVKYMKAFGLEFKDEKGSLYLDPYSSEYNLNYSTMVNFTVEVDEDKKVWYIAPEKLSISVNDSSTDYPSSEIQTKLILDTTTWSVYIPKAFFFDNIEKIIPEKGKCQIVSSGYFQCECDSNYEKVYPSFYFVSAEGRRIQILPTDYIALDSTTKNCHVYLMVNYEEEYWRTGINVLNNNYTIFDLENKKFIIAENLKVHQSYNFILIFCLVGGLSFLFFFGGYYLYKKFIIDRKN